MTDGCEVESGKSCKSGGCSRLQVGFRCCAVMVVFSMNRPGCFVCLPMGNGRWNAWMRACEMRTPSSTMLRLSNELSLRGQIDSQSAGFTQVSTTVPIKRYNLFHVGHILYCIIITLLVFYAITAISTSSRARLTTSANIFLKRGDSCE